MQHKNEDVLIMSEQLFKIYKKPTLNKQELAVLMGVSLSYISKSIARGYGVPNYKKLANKQNSKVIFNIFDIADFLSSTTKTL